MNNQVEHYMQLPYRVEIYPDENGAGYTAAIPDLPGCITSGDTPQEALTSIDEAKLLWLEVAINDGDPIPEPTPLAVERYSGKFLVRAPRSLHRRLIKRAEIEGVSLNQLVVSMISESMGKAQAKESFDLRIETVQDAMRSYEFAWTTFRTKRPKPSGVIWKSPLEVERIEELGLDALSRWTTG